MLDQNAILDANDVRRNPVHRLAEARKSPVHDHKVFFGQNRSRFVLQRRRDAFDEIEQALSARLNMSAVLNVVRRPITFGCRIVTLIEKRVERFQDKLLVVLLCLLHRTPLLPSRFPQSFDPPSTGILAPVIQRAASDARNATTSATSSGLPIRFNACISSATSRPASVFVKFDISVSITPGATAFTRMPCGPRIAAQFLTRSQVLLWSRRRQESKGLPGRTCLPPSGLRAKR